MQHEQRRYSPSHYKGRTGAYPGEQPVLPAEPPTVFLDLAEQFEYGFGLLVVQAGQSGNLVLERGYALEEFFLLVGREELIGHFAEAAV